MGNNQTEMSMSWTTVVNLHQEPYDVYIGRAGHGQDGYFGNPFTMENGDRTQSLIQFQEYFNKRIANDPEYRRRIEELRGKCLGCFCKPKPCHGDIIAQWLNERSR